MADFELLAPGGHQELVDEVLDRLDTKADYDGYYQQLTAGAADSLTGRGDGVAASYLYRTTGGDADVADGTATVKSIHGRTVVWNQRVGVTTDAIAGNMGTKTFDSSTGIWSIASINASTDAFGFYTIPSATRGVIGGHRSLVRAKVKLSTAANVRFGAASNYTTFAVGTDFTPIATVITPNTTVAVSCYTNGGDGLTMQVKEIEVFDLTQMFGAGNEPSTVAEFEAMYPDAYYPYDASSLLSVQMEGIETVGFNQWDGTYSSTGHYLNSNGVTSTDTEYDITDYIPVIGGQTYYVKGLNGSSIALCWYDAEKQYIGGIRNFDLVRANPVNTFTVPSNAVYVRSSVPKANAATFCINLSWSGYRNGEYEPYWKSERTIPATDLRSAGTVYDEQTATERITRVAQTTIDGSGVGHWVYSVNAVDDVLRCRVFPHGLKVIPSNGTDLVAVGFTSENNNSKPYACYQSNDSLWFILPQSAVADLTVAGANAWFAAHPTDVTYQLATPAVTTYDPPLNLTYKAAAGGTERILHTDPTAAPTLVVTYGSTADGIRDRALACIAPVENGLASANYSVGSYLIHGGTLCRVTTAIATGEAITIGTNVVATTVMAELLTLTQ